LFAGKLVLLRIIPHQKFAKPGTTMPAAMENRPPEKFRGVFADFSDVGRLGGWDLQFRQLDSGPQSIPAVIVASERVAIMNLKFNRSFHQLGCAPKGMVSFGLPTSGMRDWFGKSYRDNSILPFNYDSGVDGVSREGFEAHTLSVEEGFLNSVAEICRVPVPDFLHVPESGVYIADSPPVRRVRRAIHRLVTDDSVQLDEQQEQALVVDLLSAAITESRIDDKSTPATRARAIRLALGYLEEHSRDAITVGDLCAATGVSWRTLDRAFKERFGVGPKGYLQRHRLAGVRAELLVSPSNTVIADVANAWGFWHMGQFASDYRGLFDELPSQTLQRVSR
jgi:AraC-like DNA-binding protein